MESGRLVARKRGRGANKSPERDADSLNEALGSNGERASGTCLRLDHRGVEPREDTEVALLASRARRRETEAAGAFEAQLQTVERRSKTLRPRRESGRAPSFREEARGSWAVTKVPEVDRREMRAVKSQHELRDP